MFPWQKWFFYAKSAKKLDEMLAPSANIAPYVRIPSESVTLMRPYIKCETQTYFP